MAVKLDNPNKVFRELARELRKNSTLSEILLWLQLKNRQFMGLDFDRQKVINNRYIADLFCAQYDLILEIDGRSHDGKPEHDAERHNYLSELGFFVIHIGDLDVKTNMDGVLEWLKQIINTIHSGQYPIDARNHYPSYGMPEAVG
jgi:very-short-patch-repair endonuclease